MHYLGDVLAGVTVRFFFDTSDATGAGITLAGTPAIRAYKGNSTTESSTGLTLTTDFDSRTGLHLVEVDLSSDGTFYAAGSDITIVLTAGTVSGINIFPKVLAQFSIANRAVAVDTGGRVSADLKRINGTTVNGNGSGTPWGP